MKRLFITTALSLTTGFCTMLTAQADTLSLKDSIDVSMNGTPLQFTYEDAMNLLDTFPAIEMREVWSEDGTELLGFEFKRREVEPERLPSDCQY